MSFWDDWREYGKWSDDVRNNIPLVKQEFIYMGIIVAVCFAVITYSLDLIFLVLKDFFGIALNQYIALILRIIILLLIFSLYINYVQFSQFRDKQK